MGLDSVELLIELETFFAIDISDREAENILTVQDAVNCISSRIVFTDNGRDLKKDIFNRLASAIAESGVAGIIRPDEKIFDLIPVTEKETWDKLAQKMNCQLPTPYLKGAVGKLIDKFFPSERNFENTSIDRFVDLTAAVNFQTIFKKREFKNEYEVMIAVMAITIDRLGVSPFEVFPSSSFTNDLGVD